MSKNIKKEQQDDDDWETDPDYVNDVSEQEQRWGGRKRDAGNFRFISNKKYLWLSTNRGNTLSKWAFIIYVTGAIDMDQFRKDIVKEDEEQHKKKVADSNQAAGYRPDNNSKKWSNYITLKMFPIMLLCDFYC